MSLVRFNPRSSLFNRWPSVWDDDDFASMFNPANTNIDVYETEDEVVVQANVAGVQPDEVDITFEKGVLWIKAEKAEETDSEEGKQKFYSKSNWSYSYKVAVPGSLDHTIEPEAAVKDGVLTVTFKKAEHSKPKKLTVKAT